MAQCVQSVQEFVQDTFVPMVAVLCSEEAERVTRKNNLNFAELLRPFCRLTSDGKLSGSRATGAPDSRSHSGHARSLGRVASVFSLLAHWPRLSSCVRRAAGRRRVTPDHGASGSEFRGGALGLLVTIRLLCCSFIKKLLKEFRASGDPRALVAART